MITLFPSQGDFCATALQQIADNLGQRQQFLRQHQPTKLGTLLGVLGQECNEIVEVLHCEGHNLPTLL